MKHKFSLSINRNILKKSKYQQYFRFYCLHTSFVFILVQLLVEYSNYSNKCRIQRCGVYQGEGAYFNMDTQKFGAYLTPGAYQRKFISYFYIDIHLVTLNRTETRSRSQFYKIPFQCGLFLLFLSKALIQNEKVPIPVFLLDLSLLKGTLMKILKFPYMFVFMSK